MSLASRRSASASKVTSQQVSAASPLAFTILDDAYGAPTLGTAVAALAILFSSNPDHGRVAPGTVAYLVSRFPLRCVTTF